MGTSDPTNLLQRLQAAVRQDPKKTGILAILGMVLAVMAGRTVMNNKTPARASAGVNVSTASAGTTSSARPRTSDSRAHLSESTERASKLNQKIRDWMSDPVKPPTRNLFAVNFQYYPTDGSRPAQGVKTAADGEFWSRMEKSLMLQADQRDKRDILLANFKAEASKLRLDSIIMGDHPKAMIDGKLVAEGDVVAQFRVLKIESRRIIVEREGIRLEIQMK